MKKNFLKFLLLGVFTLSLGAGFVGCKDYDDDIDELQKQIDANKTSIAAIQAELDGLNIGTMVKDVVKSDKGIKVTYTNGTSAEIELGNGGGTTGTMSIGSDGYWYDGTTKTGFLATGIAPTVSENGFWQFPVNVVDGKVVYEESDIYAGGAYIVDATTHYELWIGTQGSTTLQKVVISKGGVENFGVEYLGWTSKKYNEDASLSTNFDKTNTLTLNHAYLTKITLASDGSAFDWSGKGTYKVNQVVVWDADFTNATTGKGVFGVSMSTVADLDALNFQVQNTKGDALGLEFNTPVMMTKALTRAAGKNAVYQLTYKNVTDATFDAATDKFAFTNANIAYNIVETNSGVGTDYNVIVTSTKTTVPTPVGRVSKIGKTNYVSAATIYEVELNKDIAVAFTDYVLDYYVEIPEAIVSEFGITIDKSKGTFKVTKQRDPSTPATFTMKIYKLGYDSKVYIDEVTIKPDRATLGTTTYALGDLLIETAHDANGNNVAVGSPFVMDNIILNLSTMFNDLGTTGTQDWRDDVDFAKTTITLKEGSNENKKFVPYNTNNLTTNLTVLPATGTTPAPSAATAARLAITPEYATSTTSPNIAKDKLNKAHTLTIQFRDANNYILNTVTVTFTPVIPSLADVLAREAGYWDGDVLQAYYVNPAPSYISTNNSLATMYDMTPAFKDLSAIANLNVYFALNSNQQIGSTNVTTVANLVGTYGHTINITQAPTPADDPYKEKIDIQINGTTTNYMGLYTYDNASDYDFQVQVMSALFEGSIVPASGSVVQLISGSTAPTGMDLTHEKIVGKTYTGQPYSIFKEKVNVAGTDVIGYAYSYIKSVEFVKVGSNYNIIGAGGSYVNSVEPSVPLFDANGVLTQASRVQLEGNNIAVGQTVNGKITVRVTDRFYKVLEQDVDLSITAQ